MGGRFETEPAELDAETGAGCGTGGAGADWLGGDVTFMSAMSDWRLLSASLLSEAVAATTGAGAAGSDGGAADTGRSLLPLVVLPPRPPPLLFLLPPRPPPPPPREPLRESLRLFPLSFLDVSDPDSAPVFCDGRRLLGRGEGLGPGAPWFCLGVLERLAPFLALFCPDTPPGFFSSCLAWGA